MITIAGLLLVSATASAQSAQAPTDAEIAHIVGHCLNHLGNRKSL
jgi:hypothetical protein